MEAVSAYYSISVHAGGGKKHCGIVFGHDWSGRDESMAFGNKKINKFFAQICCFEHEAILAFTNDCGGRNDALPDETLVS
jgi:hypothetical protein